MHAVIPEKLRQLLMSRKEESCQIGSQLDRVAVFPQFADELAHPGMAFGSPAGEVHQPGADPGGSAANQAHHRTPHGLRALG